MYTPRRSGPVGHLNKIVSHKGIDTLPTSGLSLPYA